MAGTALAFAVANLGIGIGDMIQSSGDAAARVTCGALTLGLCSSIAVTGATDVILNVAKLVTWPANVVTAGLDLDAAIETRTAAYQLKCSYDTMMINNIGVTYESGSADYAEWLPKLNPNEKFGVADIVGVHGGFIKTDCSRKYTGKWKHKRI